MPERRSVCPELYPPEGAHPPLFGQRCGGCGRVAFPPNPYGCEACGAPAEQLAPLELAGAGTLQAFATTHLYQGRDIEAPFTVATIALDDGPAVRALLTCKRDEGLAIGARVRSVLVPRGQDDEGHELVELHFEPVSGMPG